MRFKGTFSLCSFGIPVLERTQISRTLEGFLGQATGLKHSLKGSPLSNGLECEKKEINMAVTGSNNSGFCGLLVHWILAVCGQSHNYFS